MPGKKSVVNKFTEKTYPEKNKFTNTQFTNYVVHVILFISYTAIMIHYKLQKLYITNLIILNFLVTVNVTLKNNLEK